MIEAIQIGPEGDIDLWLRAGARISSVRAVPIILDVNSGGQWVRGFEILSPGFDIEAAIRGIVPVRPPSQARPGVATYDPEVNAAYFHFGEPAGGRVGNADLRPAGAVEVTSEWGLDASGRLVRVRIPAGSVPLPAARFVGLLRADDTRL